MEKKIEYRVRPVTRYIVTRWEGECDPTGDVRGMNSVVQHGGFDNHATAYAVAYALCKQEHDALGWPIGDERIKYPSSHPDCRDAQTEVHPSNTSTADYWLAAMGAAPGSPEGAELSYLADIVGHVEECGGVFN